VIDNIAGTERSDIPESEKKKRQQQQPIVLDLFVQHCFKEISK